MIRIEVEAVEETIISWNTQLKGNIFIYDNYRDIENVEKAVKYVMKMFNSKKFHDVSVSFIYENGSIYGRTTGRLFNIFNGGKITECHWSEHSATADTRFEHDKLSRKLVKAMYLECADKAINYEKASA